ncbi:MAG: hypothetical protein KGL39_17580 [Patescibacteria group bacterium]|nr:hypothetical protein [Patescibacteria group bacterium]
MPRTVMRDGIAIEANLRIERRSLDGRLLGAIEVANLVVTVGRNLVRDFLSGAAVTALSEFAIGTGSAAPANTDTQLVTEVFRDIFTSVSSPMDGQLQIQYYLGSTSANGYTISEAGLFGNGATAAANSGTLYARGTFAGEAKDSTQAWTFTWTLNFTAS